MESTRYPRVFIVAAFFVALAAGAYLATQLYEPVVLPILEVIPPFAIALAFAFLLDPAVDWLQKRGLSRGMGVAVTGITFVVLFGLLLFLVVPQIAMQATTLATNLPGYTERASEALNELMSRHRSILERLRLPTTLSDWVQHFSAQIEVAAKSSLSFVAGALTAGLSKLLWVIIIPLATLWLLKDLDLIKAKVVHFTPERHKERLMRTSAAIGGVLGRYVRGMLAVAVIYSTFTSVWLSLAGLEYALIIGGLSGFLYLVPYVGALTTIVATGIAVVVQPHTGLGYAGMMMALLAIQSFVLFDLVVTPKVVGGNVGVHPVLMLFSLALGARLFGVVGMVAAVPFAAAVQVALGQYFPHIHDDLRTHTTPKKPSEDTRRRKRH